VFDSFYMKKILFLTFAVLAFGVVGFFYGRRKGPHLQTHPKKGPIVESIYGLGTVQSDNVYNIKLGVTAMIKRVFVKEGEFVKKGQKLILFDENSVQSQIAPFAGFVTQINYFPGETVFPQASILTLMDLERRYISVALDQGGALRVRPQQKALLSFDSSGKGTFTGNVRAIFPRQGQLVAHIDCPELPPEILPGMTADVSIVVHEKSPATLIPLKTIQQGKIWISRAGSTQAIPVQLGIVDAEWAEVLSPTLSENDILEIPGE